MAATIGAYLRELREARQLSINGLAGKAGVAKSTLSRWEGGRFQPRVPELEAVLAALGASPGEREQALARVAAPRAVQRVREEAQAHAGDVWEELGVLPAGGDLLRAMRQRRGLSQEQVAARLGVRVGAVSYWEQSRTAPSAERREALLTLLGAQPEERATLAEGRRFLVPPLEATAGSLDALEQTLAALEAQMERGQRVGIDLGFLALEARLWPLAQRRPSARVLLAQAWARHAEWLTWYDRRREAFGYAERVLELARGDAGPPLALGKPVAGALHTSAKVTARGISRNSPARAVELLQRWLSFREGPEWETALCREMADYALESRQLPAAWDFSLRARAAAERTGHPRALRISQNVQARVLIRMGRHKEALELLPADEDGVPVRRLMEDLRRVEALLGPEERGDAHQWLTRAYGLIDRYGYTNLRDWADGLARQL